MMRPTFLQLSLLMDSVWKIVERKRFEEELLESAQKYNTIINTSLDGLAIIDQNGVFQDVNETYCQMSGYSKNELLKSNLKDIEFAETSHDVEKHIQNVMQTGRTVLRPASLQEWADYRCRSQHNIFA